MNRYSIKQSDFPAAIKYIKTGEDKISAPNWAVKYKDDLSIKNGKIFYQVDRELVSKERVSDYLREQIYSKDAKIPFGRDSSYYQLVKQCVGVTRRVLMEFLRSQKSLGSTRPSLAKPKQMSGIKIKKLTLETDLIFVRRPDLVKANKIFADQVDKKETYILTTVEKSSGLTRLAYIQSKSDTNAELEKQIKWFAKRFKVKTSDFAMRSDRGDEYNMERLKKLIPDYRFVKTAQSCERRNRLVQQNLFRLLKNRQATTVKDAVRKSQVLINATYNRIQKKTPNEVTEQKHDETLKKFNSKRKTFVKGDKRKEFDIGQRVRILTDEKVRRGIGYKSYKGLAFSEKVYVISKKTKKQPVKYRVGGNWYLQSSLLKSAARDQESEELIKKRDKDLEDEDEKRAEAIEVEQKKKDIEKAKKFKAGERTTRGSAAFRAKMKAMKEKDKAAEKAIEDAEEEYQKQKNKPKRVKPKLKKEVKNGDFKKLHREFKKIIRWLEGEANKSYEGREKELGDIYNNKVHDGRDVVAKMKKYPQAKKIKNLKYFDDFLI